MNHCCRVTHRLRRSVSPIVLVLPVEHAHAQELEEDLIPILPWDATTKLFADPDHVPPQDIVVVCLGQGVIHPDVLVEVLDVRSVVQHPNGNLEFPSKSADNSATLQSGKTLLLSGYVRIPQPMLLTPCWRLSSWEILDPLGITNIVLVGKSLRPRIMSLRSNWCPMSGTAIGVEEELLRG